MRRDAVQFGKQFPKFRRNRLPPLFLLFQLMHTFTHFNP